MSRKLAIVQGRLSSFVATNFQYFPIHNWRTEFYTARDIGFNGIEWVLSDLSNPIFDPNCRKEIVNIVNETQVSVSSVSLDIFKYKTLNCYSFELTEWVLMGIEKLSRKTEIGRVSFPVEEQSTIFDAVTKKEVLCLLKKIVKLSKKFNFKICIETDLSPKAINFLLKNDELDNIGLVVDIGNSIANGYDLADYFNLFGDRIIGIHIKDRTMACGSSVKLGEGAAEFTELKNQLNKAVNINDITLQTFRTKDDYINDAKEAREFLLNYIN